MRPTVATVLDRLAAEGLAPADAAERARAALAAGEPADDAVPWYVRLAAGAGAWVATGFLVAFLLAVGVEPDEPAGLAVGLAMVVGAVLLRRRATAEFARQLALAASFAGQALVVLRVGEVTDSAVGVALASLALSAVLVVVMPDAAHRFMSTVIGAVAGFVAVTEPRLAWGLGEPGAGFVPLVRGADLAVLALVALTAWAWRGDRAGRRPALADALAPVRHGLAVGTLVLLLLDAFLSPAFVRSAPDVLRWQLGAATTLGVAAALCALAVAVAREHGTARGEPLAAAIGGVLLLAALTLPTPGIVAAAAALALGFDRRNAVLLGVGVLFLIAFTALFYQGLRLTLLEKAGVLAASGALLLAAGAYVARRFPASPRAEGAP